MIEFRDVHLRYHYDEFELLKGATFTLNDGINTVLCDAQSGKTSLCRLLIADVKPTEGQIFVDGKDVQSITNSNLDILYLPSDPVFFEGRSILYNVAYPLAVRKVARDVRNGVAAEMCERFSIPDCKQKMRKLPIDMRKRVAIARGATVSRKYVLWDDFWDGDVQAAKQCLALFEDATNVIFTSDPRLALGNTVVMDGGVAVFQGNADDAKQIAAGLQWLACQRGTD